MKIIFFNMSHITVEGVSGGETIIMHLFKEWSKYEDVDLHIITTNIGKKKWELFGIKSDKVHALLDVPENQGNLARYFSRAWAMNKNYDAHELIKDADVIYSASDFWPDSFPASYFKKAYPRLVWIAGFYLFAPFPGAKNSPYKGKNFLKGLMYYISQQPAFNKIRNESDMVYITSEPDREIFLSSKRGYEDIIVVRGGVDTTESEKYLSSGEGKDTSEKKYDAVFMGRFHYQKGVLLLIDIWKEVVKMKSDAKLAAIGDGPQMQDMKERILEYGLQDNIELLGIKTGSSKHEVFKDSKMALHPATYDSGGMAAAEAMAWGMPGVSYDLPALKTYYPQGMFKVKEYADPKAFADLVIKLLNDSQFYNELRDKAIELIRTQWEWGKRARDVFELSEPRIIKHKKENKIQIKR